MTELRKGELLAKIVKVASDDPEVNSGTEQNIKVSYKFSNGDIVIDLVVHNIQKNEEEPDKMTVSYVACKSVIKNATKQSQEKACQMLHRIIETSLKDLIVPGQEQERNEIQQALEQQGREQMLAKLPN